MKIKKEIFVEFLRPDLTCFFFGMKRNIVKKVSSRDVSKLKVPADTFAFIFFDVLSTIVQDDKKDVELKSGRINISPKHYYGGTVYKMSDFKRKIPNARYIKRDFIGSGYKKAIHRRDGIWAPFKSGEIFIEAK